MAVPTKSQVDALQTAAAAEFGRLLPAFNIQPPAPPLLYGETYHSAMLNYTYDFSKLDRDRFTITISETSNGMQVLVNDLANNLNGVDNAIYRVSVTYSGQSIPRGIRYINFNFSPAGNFAQLDAPEFRTPSGLQEFFNMYIDYFRGSESVGVPLSEGIPDSSRFDYTAIANTDEDGRVFLTDFSGNPIDWNAIAPQSSHGIEWVDDEYIYHTANITYRDPDGLYVFLENNEKPPGVIRINR